MLCYHKNGDIMKKKKYIFFILLFILSIYQTYQYLESKNINLNQKEFVQILLSPNEDLSSFQYLFKKIFPTKQDAVKTLLKKTYQGKMVESTKKVMKEKEIQNPLIYIYNTHQTEEYTPSTFVEYSVMPTVQMNNYILEEKFEQNGYSTIVEEQNIKTVLNEHKWNYAGSYNASRIFLEQAKKNYPTLKYFIDVHRDSLKKEATAIELNNKSYAKILFIVGLENPNYEQNLSFTEKINNQLNEKYPGLSKGIYKKEGTGVNGVYNQDFSPYTILVEMGGPENTVDEVLNTSLAFSDCFLEVIKNNV